MADIDDTPFHQAWGRLEAWLVSHSPDDHATLLPPATPSDLRTLEDALGFALHPELTALLQRHNGSCEHHLSRYSPPFPAGAFLPMGHRLAGTAGIATGHRELVELDEQYPSTDFWHEDDVEGHRRHWVPFAYPNDGGLAFIDHHPGATYGHVYEFGLGSGAVEASRWADSLTQFIATVTDSLTTGSAFRHFCPSTFQHPSGALCVDWRSGL